jgi:Ca2+-binding RTX toxin-like protein
MRGVLSMAIVHGTNNAEIIDAVDGVTNLADTIYGYGGKDKIFGLGGNDFIIGGAGADEIDGGGDIDAAFYTDSSEGVWVTLTTGVGQFGTAAGDKLTSIENLYGSAFGDLLEGNDAGNALSGLQGNDILDGGEGADVLSGGADDDMLKGGAGADKLHGGDGRDVLIYSGSAAAITISLLTNSAAGGEAEGDTISGIEDVLGSGFDDTLHGDANVNWLFGQGGNDVIKGYGGEDVLSGGNGEDRLFGMDDADRIEGYDGNDKLYGGAGGDVMYGGEDADELYGEAGEDLMFGGASADYLDGGTEADDLYGGEGADTLKGGDGADVLAGYVGFDILVGGMGQDALTGGADPDFFAWQSATETSLAENTADLVTDFNFAEGDRLDLSGIDADVYAAGNQAFTFIGTAAFSGAPGEINYYHAGGDTFIQLQTGTAVDIEGLIHLSGIHTPTASWFIL